MNLQPTQLYEGTKQMYAMPLTRGEYNAYRGWITPDNENPDDPGYLVEYVNGGKPNDDRHKGYISWSPKDVFESTYRPVDVKLSSSDFDQLHNLLYSAQRTTGDQQMQAIGDACILLSRMRENGVHTFKTEVCKALNMVTTASHEEIIEKAKAKSALAYWDSGVGILWEVHAHGKPLGYVVSPLNWDAEGVYQALVAAGYAEHVEVKLSVSA